MRSTRKRSGAGLVPVLAITIIALPLAGCVGTDQGPSAVTDELVSASASTHDPAPVFETSWEGHIVAGAAYDLPGHFSETETIVEPVVRAGGALMFEEAPSMLEVQLDWTGAPGTEVMLMVGPPTHTEEEGGNFATEFSDDPVHCLRIPVDDIVEGHWSAMVHTLVGADVEFTITTRSAHASPEWQDTHGHSVTGFYPEATEPRTVEACTGEA